MMQMTGAQLMVRLLERQGVRTVAGIPGGAILPFYDALSGSAPAIAQLLQRRSYYFVPFGQDDSYKKPCSLKSDFTLLPDTLEAALRGVQIQPLLL